MSNIILRRRYHCHGIRVRYQQMTLFKYGS